MTDSVYYVNTLSIGGDGTGGIDVITGDTAAFSSMQSAIIALSSTAVSGDNITIQGKGVDTSFTVNGFSSGVNVVIESHESARHSGVWDGSKYYFTGTGHMVGVLDGSIELRYLQITDTTTNVRKGVSFGSGGKSATVYRCIVKDVTTAFFNSSSNSIPTLEECLVYRSSSAIEDGSSQGAGFNVKRCTFVDCNDLNIGNKNNLPIFTGNAFSNTANGISGTVDSVSNYNATNLSSLGLDYVNNTGDLVNESITFVDSANDDYRIVSTSPLKTAGSDGGQIGAFYESGVTPAVDPIVPHDQACKTVNQSSLLDKLSPIQANNQTAKSVSEKATVGKLSEVKASNQVTLSINAKATLKRLSVLSASNQITGTVNQSQKLIRTANLTISNQITDTVSEYAYIERLAALNAYNQSCVTVSSKGKFIDPTNLYAYSQALKTVNQPASLGKSAKLTASNQVTKAVNQSALLTRLAKLNASNQISRSVNQQASLSRTAFISSYSQICKSIYQSSALGRFAPVSALNQTTITVNQYAYLYSGTFPTFGDDDVVTVVVGGKFTCSVQSKPVSAIVKTKVYNSTVTTKLITASSMPSIKG